MYLYNNLFFYKSQEYFNIWFLDIGFFICRVVINLCYLFEVFLIMENKKKRSYTKKEWLFLMILLPVSILLWFCVTLYNSTHWIWEVCWDLWDWRECEWDWFMYTLEIFSWILLFLWIVLFIPWIISFFTGGYKK